MRTRCIQLVRAQPPKAALSRGCRPVAGSAAAHACPWAAKPQEAHAGPCRPKSESAACGVDPIGPSTCDRVQRIARLRWGCASLSRSMVPPWPPHSGASVGVRRDRSGGSSCHELGSTCRLRCRRSERHDPARVLAGHL
eukprot:scaffold9479_cov109-Isochrysis_galbana.AAC.5